MLSIPLNTNTFWLITITYKYNSDAIVYALGTIISFARSNQYILLAQSIWWIAFILAFNKD